MGYSKGIDSTLIVPALLLIGVGLLMLYGFNVGNVWSWDVLFFKQLVFFVIATVVFVIVSRINYVSYRLMSTPLYFGIVGILLGVLFLGVTVRGTAGWIDFGPVQFQPVELAKVVLIIFLASFISQKKTQLNEFTRLVASFFLVLIPLLLVLAQPDFGSAMVLLGIWLGMTLVSGIRKRYLFGMVVGGTLIAFLGWFVLADYQQQRILTVFQPERDVLGSGYNVIQSLVAVGSGGFFGKGIGHGSQSQLNFLPEKHTDFIFAVIAENLGLLGAIFVLVVIGILLYRLKRVGDMASDSFGYLLCAGVFFMVLVQVVVNIGMNVGLFPVTGIPLPLVSYGGSSLISAAIALGIVHNISRRNQRTAGPVSQNEYLDGNNYL